MSLWGSWMSPQIFGLLMESSSPEETQEFQVVQVGADVETSP